jgi:hypothetical protein
MLTDRCVEVKRRAARRRAGLGLVKEYGRFIASLAGWDWFGTFTIRGKFYDVTPSPVGSVRADNRTILDPDPRIASWEPSSRYSRKISGPGREAALAQVNRYFRQLAKAAPHRIGYVLVEELGDLGRLHFHALISGVATLRRESWRAEAERAIGRIELRTYVPSLGASSYIVKSLAREQCELHFGGELAGIDVSRAVPLRYQSLQGQVATPSVSLSSGAYHFTLRRRHR